MAEQRKQFYSTGEVAKMAKVSSSYIRRLILEGKLRAEKIGRDWAISANEVMRFLRERED